jgi:MFS family permease/peptidoglycan hydrolase-like protein with peptidoglycan-binding domain
MAEEETTGGALWRNGNFLKFWLGETVSLFGTQVTVLALPLTAVLVLNSDAAEVGLLRFLQMVPYLLFGLVFGVWVDRVRRRPVMLAANLIRLVLVAVVPILALSGQLRLSLLYVVTFLIGMASVLFDVSWMSYVPTLIQDKRYLVEANAKLGATSSAADAAGPGLAGTLVGVFTAPVAIAANAVSYLVSLISLLLIRIPEQAPAPAARRRLLNELGEGLRFVFGNRYLRAVAMVGAFCNFFTTATQSMFILYAVDDWGLSPSLLGMIFSMGAAGGIVGAVLAGPLTRSLPVGRVYAGALIIAFCAPVLIPAARGPALLVDGMFVAAFFVGYVGVAVTNIVILSLRQTVTPSSFMGRMNAAMRTLMFGMGALGGPAGGLLAGAIGVHGALWVTATGSVLVLVPVLLSPVRKLKTMPTPAASAGSEPEAAASAPVLEPVRAHAPLGTSGAASVGNVDLDSWLADLTHVVRRQRIYVTVSTVVALACAAGLVASTFVILRQTTAAQAGSVLTAAVEYRTLRPTVEVDGTLTGSYTVVYQPPAPAGPTSPANPPATPANPPTSPANPPKSLANPVSPRPGSSPGPTSSARRAPAVTRVAVHTRQQLRPGRVLLEADGRPLIVLRGAVPLGRDLTAGAKGPDVTQLQQTLRAMGYPVTPDRAGVLGAGTRRAVRALYRARGYLAPASLNRKVVLPRAEVLLVPSFPAWVDTYQAKVGTPLSAVRLSVIGGTLWAVAKVDPVDAAQLSTGMQAHIDDAISGGTETGQVKQIGPDPPRGAAGTEQVPPPRGSPSEDQKVGLAVLPARPLDLRWAGRTVRIKVELASQPVSTLAVPVGAIVTGADGRTTVTRLDPAGQRVTVAVRTGVTADGFVAVKPLQSHLWRSERVVLNAISESIEPR